MIFCGCLDIARKWVWGVGGVYTATFMGVCACVCVFISPSSTLKILWHTATKMFTEKNKQQTNKHKTKYMSCLTCLQCHDTVFLLNRKKSLQIWTITIYQGPLQAPTSPCNLSWILKFFAFPFSSLNFFNIYSDIHPPQLYMLFCRLQSG